MAKGKGLSVAQAKQAALQQKMLHNKLMAARGEGFNQGYLSSVVVSMWILRTRWGYGKIRLSEFVHEYTKFVREHMIEIDKGSGVYQGFDVFDIMQALEEECDIHFDMKNGIFHMPAVKIEEEKEDE